MFGLMAGGGGLAFYLFRLFGEDPFDDGSMVLHVAACLVFLLAWLLCRGRARSRRFIRTTEAAAVLGGCGLHAGMGQFIPVIERPDLIVVLALAFGFLARSIYVPSGGKRTLFLGLATGVMLVMGVWASGMAYDARIYTDFGPEWRTKSPEQIALYISVNAAAWWSLFVGLSVGASRVIYGLRKEVRKAQQLGQYTLLEKLGEGGMGVVYRAQHAMLRRPTAVKLLPLEKVGEASLARFEREVQRTAELSHPNIITVFDYGRTQEGVLYYAMELVDGATAQEVVSLAGPLPPARVLYILAQLADALAEAHAVGLIHRDVKPANVLLCVQGRHADVAKLVDFGLVKHMDSIEPSVTATGVITGTPLYMAPEALVDPAAVDARSDLYALGALGYFLLTAEHVFTGRTMMEVCSHHLRTAPVPPSIRLGRDVSPALEALILSCLAKAPTDRPASADAVTAALLECTVEGSWDAEARRAWWAENHARLRANATGIGTHDTATAAIDLAGRGVVATTF